MTENGFIAGFELERVLGRGGMGTVYLARHPRLPRSVALKLLDEKMFGDEEAKARFAREADLAARLDHPNIVAVYDRGVEGRRPWIAMQYVHGTDAGAVAIFDPARAVRVVSEVAEALDFAHGRGVLHRDIKPANILLGEVEPGLPERVMLADFGIARLRLDQNPLTQTGTFTATLAYASPEQLSGMPLGPACDQYSLACTLFVLLTGSVPFSATNPVAVIQSHMSEPPPLVSRMRPGLPDALDAVLCRAMAKQANDRYDTCGEFVDAVRQAFDGAHAAVPSARSAQTISAVRLAPTLFVPPKPNRASAFPEPTVESSGQTGTAENAGGSGGTSRSARRSRLRRIVMVGGLLLLAVVPIGFVIDNMRGASAREAVQARYKTIGGAFPGLVGEIGSDLGSGFGGAACKKNSAWPAVDSVICTSADGLPFVVSDYGSAEDVQDSLTTFRDRVGPGRRESHTGCAQDPTTILVTRPGAAPLHVTTFPDDPNRSRFRITVDIRGAAEDQSERLAAFYINWWRNAPLCD
ncbi:serine/threonine-protein kinase [Nocardia sp. NPDC060259]|uniref:serine/threonine-protein kinase n=1 Tax=Nocardia sp. NPDC060259 TaxID=3347088 RepID=UPI00364F097F